MLTRDIQYDATIADLFDPLISSAMPTDALVSRCARHVRGRDVLDVGIGTGRVAIPLAQSVHTLIGIDNSQAMLEKLSAKQLPPNLTVVPADVREPLPVPQCTAAISTMGSIAYVGGESELREAMLNVADVLAAGSPFVVETYSFDTYATLSQLGPVMAPSPTHPSTCTLTARVDDETLTVETHVAHADGRSTTFEERTLLLERGRFEKVAMSAGFEIVDSTYAVDFAPFDWFVLQRRGRD